MAKDERKDKLLQTLQRQADSRKAATDKAKALYQAPPAATEAAK